MTFTSHMQLERNVTLSDKVNLVALPEEENEDLPTAHCLVPGWGAMDYENGIESNVLQEVNVTVNASLNCETPSKLCTKGSKGPFKVSELTAHTKKKKNQISSLHF